MEATSDPRVAEGRAGEPLKLIIVDDHDVVTAGLRWSLERDERFVVVGVAGCGEEARTLARRTLPDVAILDLHLPDVSGVEVCRRLRTLLPSLTVVVLSSYLNEAAVRSAVEAGAYAYVTKAAGLPELQATLERIWERGPEATDPGTNVPGIVHYLEGLVQERSHDLAPTPQQARVLELLAEGLTYRRIAESLMISESTVRFHIQKLKVKFGTTSKTEMIVQCIRMGIIASPEGEAPAG